MPHTFIIAVILIIFSFLASNVFGQTSAEQKTQDLIAALAKTKHKKKEKKGFSFEHYIDVKNEPIVKQNIRDYAGVYELDDDYRLELQVAQNGAVSGSGYDSPMNSQRQSFTLKNARIEGALLTAVKVYPDGRTENFEAVFVNRTIASGTNQNEINSRETRYGLGFVYRYQHSQMDVANRIFLEFKP
jgi:hypothetical protein